MEETRKIVIVIVSAIVMSIIGMMLGGFYGAAMGFVLTIIGFGLFSVWNRMRKE